MSNPRWLDRDWAVVRALNEKLLRQGRDRHATPATAAEIDDRAGQELVQVAIESRVDQAKAEQRFEDAYRDLPSEHGFETVGHEQKLAVEPSINRLVPPLFAAKVRLRRTVDALEAFVAREQPGRPASYPASRHKRVVVTAVLGLVLDGGASSLLISRRLEGGVSGAFAYTAGTVLATASLAIAGASAARFCSCRTLWKRLAGGIGVGCCSAVALFVALSYAHFRDEIARGSAVDAAARASILQVLHRPFDLSFPAWLLLLLSVSTALAIAHAAFTSDDPLAGYGPHDRAPAEWRRQRDALQADLKALKANASRDLKRALLAELRAGEKLLPILHRAATAHEAAREDFRAQSSLIENARQRTHQGRLSVSSDNGNGGGLPKPELFEEVDYMKRYADAKQSLLNLRESIATRQKSFEAWFDGCEEAVTKRLAALQTEEESRR